MAASAEMINKINSLNPSDLVLVANLIDHLSKSEGHKNGDENVFQKSREACRDNWMTDDEIEAELDAFKAEKNASRN